MKKKMMTAIAVSALTLTALAGGYTIYAAPQVEAGINHVLDQNQNRNQLAKQIDHLLQGKKFNGTILVSKNGKIVLTKGYGQADFATKALNTSDTMFRIGSVTKSFTSVAIMQLAEQGKLKLDDPVMKYIPDFPSGDKITIHHLLSHTGGLGEYLNEEVLKNPTKYVSLEEIVDTISAMKLESEPGSKFMYSNSNYALLGYMIERVSHTTWDNYVNEYFFKPLNMHNSGVDINQPVRPNHAIGTGLDGKPAPFSDLDMSYLGPAGGMYSTVGDLHKFDQALLSGKLIKQESLEKMFTPVLKNYGYAWGDGQNLGLSSDWKYHTGELPGFRSFNAVNQKENTEIIMVTNQDLPLKDFMEGLTMKVGELVNNSKQ